MHMRSLRSIGLTLALVVAGLTSRPSLGQQKKSGGDKYALLVGVRKYDPNELRGLPYSEPDVVELSGVLKAEGYKPGNVVLMTQTAGADDTRFLPLAANVRKELKLLLDEIDDEGDSVLIALAGHGVQFQGENESYFCPADARLADKSTLIPLSEIYKALENSRAGLKVLLVDACRNDPQSQNSRDREVVKLESVTRPQRTPPPGGVVAFFSCSEGEKAFEHAELKHGVFFHFVIQALKGAAVGPDQNDVLVPDLVKYVTRQVKDFVREKYGVKQQPEWKGTSRDLVPLVSLGPRSLATARGTASLAVFFRPVGEPLAAGLKRPPSQPHVVFVVPGGGGDRLGLRPGDVVLQVDGFDVSTVEESTAAIRNRELGSRIELTVARAAQQVSLSGPYVTQLPDSQVMSRVRQLAERGEIEAEYSLGHLLANGQYTVKDDGEAVRWYRKAAERGHPAAQTFLGEMYAHGRGVPKDDAEAAAWCRKAAEQGYAAAQNDLGWMYREGRGVVKDDTEAVAWFRKSAGQGNALAQNSLGLMYKEGRGVTRDDTEAIAWFRKSASQGNALGQLNLGLVYRDGRGVPKDDAVAAAWFRKAAEKGHVYAQCELGLMYASGRGVPRDDAEAVAWYRKAADQGNPFAQNNLGLVYRDGRGVTKSDAEAAAWFRKATDKGFADAQVNLGFMYESGRGVPRDGTEAVAWYRKAADKGNAFAQNKLGLVYRDGRGATKDDAEAVAWLRKAADKGFADAQVNLGFMYESGRGVPKDDTEAVAWYRKAADKGNPFAEKNLGSMYRDGRGVPQ
ncbi:MAG: caspase family protein, partial [Isosphaeraceae bacterium]